MPHTRQSLARQARVKWEPMKPRQPVTATTRLAINVGAAYQEPPAVARAERPRVVALILAYNVAGMLERALSKIPRQLVDDIFVMDDGSSDGTADEARRLGLTVYSNERNLGYGGNLRRGLRLAVADHAADYV